MRLRNRRGEVDAKWHAHVAIDRATFSELVAWFTDQACRRSAAELAARLYELPFEPYAPVRRQLLMLHRAVCKARRARGLPELPVEVLPMRRRVVRPFDVLTA